MTDKEILDELISQKNWWEQRIKECHEKETGYKKELFKTNRLIELIQSKLEKQGRLLPAEWRQDNVEELTEFENAMMHIGGSFFGKNAGLDPNDTACIKEQANLLLELVPSKGWSEEDDSKLKEVLYYIEYVNKTNVTFQQKDLAHLIKWLKFLKDRVQPQPMQQWMPSEEQVLALEGVLTISPQSPAMTSALVELYEQLKKLSEK